MRRFLKSSSTPSEKDPKLYYDEYSSKYDFKRRNSRYHQLIDTLEFEILSHYLREGLDLSVLEAGCGTGLLMEKVNTHCGRLYGIDISKGMVYEAKLKGFNILCGNILSLPFKDNSFDLVYSFKVMAHIEKIREGIEELKRVTKPGGYILVDFYNRLSLRYVAKRIGGPGKITPQIDESQIYTRWDFPWQLKDYFNDRLKLVDIKGVRIVSPFAGIYKFGFMGSVFEKLESFFSSSPLKYFGGFLVCILRKEY